MTWITLLLVSSLQAAPIQDGLVAPGAGVLKLAGGFRFTEGPAADAAGNVVFSDIPRNRIHRWSVDGALTVLREGTGGANGLMFDRHGNLLACEGGKRRLTSMNAKGEVKVLADSHGGAPLNSPNDLWIGPDGAVWFTDPRYGSQAGLKQGGFHVYRLAADRRKLTRVIDDLVKPNGIIGTSDGKRLYVADAGGGKVYRYDIEGASLKNRKEFAPHRSDGMTLDEKGNLYITEKQVLVFSPEGRRLATIEIPERPANVTFGGKDFKTLFVTARTSLYSVRMKVKGATEDSRRPGR